MTEAYLVYIGNGAFIYGVPKRNLTFDEVIIHGEKRLIDSGLYELAKPKIRKQRSKYLSETKDNESEE